VLATPATTADIFCRVVDNFGDIGVCWRLARGLSAEHGWHVRLWVDDLGSFARLAPTLDIHAHRQMLDAVEVIAWRDAALAPPSDALDASEASDMPDATDMSDASDAFVKSDASDISDASDMSHDPDASRPPERSRTTDSPASAEPLMPRDVVIEAFACDPPAWFVTAMHGMATPPVWINLEYLSAEDWIEGCHGLHSRRSDGLEKIFCFPGFTANTGGLLRERDLLRTRDRFQADANAQDALLTTCGVPEAARARIAGGAAVVTLFCYPDAPLQALFGALAQRDRPTVLIAPHGVAPHTESALDALSAVERAQFVLCRIPFVPHEHFDRLLWLADLNVVRGEDSLVRALWAGRPLLWHIYPQDDAAHDVKLDAFLARTGWPDAAQVANRAFNGAASVAHASKAPADTPEDPAAPAARDTRDTRAADRADFALLHDEATFREWQTAAKRYADTVAAHRDLAATIADYGVRATD